MGFETTKGSSCRGSIYLCPALMTLIWGRQTTRVPGMEAWLWYQLRTVPGMSPQMMVLGEGMLSLGRNTQHDCNSTWKKEEKYRMKSRYPNKPLLYWPWFQWTVGNKKAAALSNQRNAIKKKCVKRYMFLEKPNWLIKTLLDLGIKVN